MDAMSMGWIFFQRFQGLASEMFVSETPIEKVFKGLKHLHTQGMTGGFWTTTNGLTIKFDKTLNKIMFLYVSNLRFV